MENNQTTPSVIAKLMGFDEPQPQHVANRPVNVFSEDYLRKIASVAMLEKSSFLLHCSARKKEGKVLVTEQVFDAKPIQSTIGAQFGFVKRKNVHGSSSYPIDVQNCHTGEPNNVLKRLLETRNPGIMSSKRVYLRSVQKLGSCSGEFEADLDQLSRIHSELKDKASDNSTSIGVLKPNSKNLHYCARSLFIGSDALHQGSNRDYMEHGSCLKHARKIIQNENKSRLIDKKAALEEIVKVRTSHRIASRARNFIKDPTVHFSEGSIPSCQGSFNLRKRKKISNQYLNGASFLREANTNIFGRWKSAKYSEEVAVPERRNTLRQKFPMHDSHGKPEKFSSSECFCRQKDNSEIRPSMVCRSKVSSTNEYIRNLPSPVFKQKSFVADPDRKSSVEASQSKCWLQKETGTGYNFNFSTIHSGAYEILPQQVNQGVQSESYKDMVQEANGHSTSDARDDLTQQKSSYNSFKGELILTCTAGDLGSVKNLRENNQLSPDSVLETAFKEGNDRCYESSSSFTDLRGLAMKLHLLNDDVLEEINSEGSVMAVSSNEDIEKGSVDFSEDYEKQWGPSRPEESRDFSYFIDVLDEAALFGWHLESWFETWHETEYPLSPSVFEALEKKYGKQTSWPKSDRRLLFDYINSGLRSIQDLCLDFGLSEKPLRKRLKSTLSKNDIEEELWMQLTQEKEAKKDSSEKVFGSELKWLELGEDISIICKEIVEFLFDQLVTEICSI